MCFIDGVPRQRDSTAAFTGVHLTHGDPCEPSAPGKSHFFLSHAEQEEQEESLQGIEYAKYKLHLVGCRVDGGEKAKRPGESEQDGQHHDILQTFQSFTGHFPVGIRRSSTAGQTMHDDEEDEEVEREEQDDDENHGEAEDCSWTQETTAG